MRAVACLLLLLSLAASLAAQERTKWRRVYTFEDSFIEMEEIKLSLGSFGRVRFRTVFDKSERLRGDPDIKYKSQVEDTELMCDERQYRITEVVYYDARGRVVASRKAAGPEEWKYVMAGSMMEKLFVPACRMMKQRRM